MQKMPQQIALPLNELHPGSGSSLIVTASNAAIVDALSRPGDWPGRCAILIGPPRSGKSLLARYFAMKSGGLVIEEADGAGEQSLFNAWNRAQQQQSPPLLLTSCFSPSLWNIGLPDLRSRLAAAHLFSIPAPDDEMIIQLIQQHLRDRGTAIGIDALHYIVRRIERSYGAAEDFARAANTLALAEGGAINLKRVKRILTPRAPSPRMG